MKYIQTFRDKIKDWNRTKEDSIRLGNELAEDAREFIHWIVEILDEILEDTIDEQITIKVNIKVIDKNIHKIEHYQSRPLDLHLNGIETYLYFSGNKKELLWNFMAGGSSLYEEIVAILEYLIKNYKKYYEKVVLKKSSSKYNV